MKFEYDPRIIEQLGGQLITSDEMAIAELIKNAYDAKSPKVNIRFIDIQPNTGNELKNVPPIIKDQILPAMTGLLSESNSDIEKMGMTCRHLPYLIVIDDTGKGMTHEELERGFFTIGTCSKVGANKDLPEKTRATLGNKGLGRLAGQRLGDVMIVETTSKDSKEIYVVAIDWNDIIKENTELPEWKIEKTDTDISYTRLWIFRNKAFDSFISDKRMELFKETDNCTSDDISLKNDLLSTINFLYSPFSKETSLDKQDAVDSFSIKFWLNKIHIPYEFQTEAIKLAETISEFSTGEDCINCQVTITPWFIERMHLRELGPDLFNIWRLPHDGYQKLWEQNKGPFEKSLSIQIPLKDVLKNVNDLLAAQDHKFDILSAEDAIKHIMPFKGKVFSFKREAILFDMAMECAVCCGMITKEKQNTISRNKLLTFLENHNGIKLYRSRYRIASLGNKDSDWLKLQQARTRGQQFFRFELGNVIGYVSVTDIQQMYIREISSRQDLDNTLEAEIFKSVLDYIFNYVFYNLHRTAYYLTHDILEQNGLLKKNESEKIKERLANSDNFAKTLQKSILLFDTQLQHIGENIALDSPDKVKNVQKDFSSIRTTFDNITQGVNKTVAALADSDRIMQIIDAREKSIQVESYNNYKLMANGLITEVFTHELHALIAKNNGLVSCDKHYKEIEKYLLENNAESIYLDDFLPLEETTKLQSRRLMEVGKLYQFLEKTFIRKGTSDDFESQDLYAFFVDLRQRMSSQLRNINFIFDSTENKSWYVPKGVLIHIFYNLVDNALYWIADRNNKAKYDKNYTANTSDEIVVEYINEDTLHFRDSGSGVLPRLENTLFAPQESGKENGRGMGLYIIKKLLESFDADIRLLPDRNDLGRRYIFEISMKQGE